MEDVDKPVIATPFGRFRCFEDQFADDLRRYGAHQRSDLAVMLSLVQPGDAVVDVGAFVGTVSVPLARAVGPRGRLYCFEPVPEHHELLVENLAENGVAEQSTAVNALVGERSATGAFTASSWEMSTATTTFLPTSHANADDDRELVSWRLDDWFAAHAADHPRIRLMKVDVEGMELAVLKGAAGLIDADRPIIEIEVGGGRDGRIRETAKFLRDHRYRLVLNLAPRDSASDTYRLGPLRSLALLGDMLSDVVAVPRELPLPVVLEASWVETHATVIASRHRLRARWRRLVSRIARR